MEFDISNFYNDQEAIFITKFGNSQLDSQLMRYIFTKTNFPWQ